MQNIADVGTTVSTETVIDRKGLDISIRKVSYIIG